MSVCVALCERCVCEREREVESVCVCGGECACVRESVCMCVHVCVRKRERVREAKSVCVWVGVK